MTTRMDYERVIDNKDEPGVVKYREEVKRLIETEVKNLLTEEIRKASQEISAENRKAIQQLVEEHRLLISEIVEDEKKAIWKRLEDLRRSILKVGL